jgi:hypothetical protein
MDGLPSLEVGKPISPEILHLINSSTGATLSTTLESGNYRGIYTANGERYL